MKTVFKRNVLSISGACLLGLYGCGGSSGGAGLAEVPVTPAPPPAVTTIDVPVSVVDGPIQNATVCVDKNNNGVCDSGEPTGKTDVAGKVTLKVDIADIGKFPILAVVGIDAVDSQTGPVQVAYTLKSPADKPSVVTPLTTLVQSVVDSTGLASSVAENQIRTQAGINVSLFDDFSKSSSADSQAAAVLARMLVITSQQQASAIVPALGTLAINGATIKQADLDKAIQLKLLQIMPVVLTSLADSSVLAAVNAKEREPALLNAAKRIVADPVTGLSAEAMAAVVGITNQVASGATATVVPVAGFIMKQLDYFNATGYTVRHNVSTLAQATPDGSGNTRLVDRRYLGNSDAISAWTSRGSSSLRQSDVHFNGSAWVNCALNGEQISSSRNAKGVGGYVGCQNLESGFYSVSIFDVSGKPMLDVYNQIVKAGTTNIKISMPAVALSAARFPADSQVIYQSAFGTASAVSYYPGSSNVLLQYSVEASAGGVATNQQPGVGCNSAEQNGNGAVTKTFEDMMARAPGNPCFFAPPGSFVYSGVTYTSQDATNEQWGVQTLSLGVVGVAPVGTGVAPGFYSTNVPLRVAFKGDGPNAVTYYACKQRFNTGSPRNCTSIGTGTYTIATQGDARIMTFNNLPLQANALDSARVMVERGGKIYSGYKSPTGAFPVSARFNTAASTALLAQLGMPAVEIDKPVRLTKTSYAGNWELIDTAMPLKSTLVQIFNNGSSSCTETDGTVTPALFSTYACGVTFSDPANGLGTITRTGVTRFANINFGFLTGAVTGAVTDSAAPDTSASFMGARR